MPDDPRPLRADCAGLIVHYEAIATASRAMVQAARHARWDEVAHLEQECRHLIETLRAEARVQPLALGEQRRRIELLRAILHDDAEVRERAEPWLQQLEGLVARPRRGAG